jgi:hypothetical protein
MPRIHPKTWDDGVMPLDEFPEDHRQQILDAVAQPHPPQRYIAGEFFRFESRAWREWHWARGQKLRVVGAPMKRRKISRAKRALVIARDGLICGICSEQVEPHDVHIDHIKPVSLGGGNELENLQVAHSRCNIKKGARV